MRQVNKSQIPSRMQEIILSLEYTSHIVFTVQDEVVLITSKDETRLG